MVASHHEVNPGDDEELTPSLENLVVLLWLKLTHPDLPKLVKQCYGTDLRSRTLASLKPEISQALSSLLDEIRSTEEARVMRSIPARSASPQSVFAQPTTCYYQNSNSRPSQTQRRQPTRLCPLCKQAGHNNANHFLSTHVYLSPRQRSSLHD